MGDADGLLETYQDERKLLDAQGVKYVTMELPEYGHGWRFWRLNREDFVPRLFSPAM